MRLLRPPRPTFLGRVLRERPAAFTDELPRLEDEPAHLILRRRFRPGLVHVSPNAEDKSDHKAAKENVPKRYASAHGSLPPIA